EHFPRAENAHRGLRLELLTELQPEAGPAGFIHELLGVLGRDRDVVRRHAEPVLRPCGRVRAHDDKKSQRKGANRLHVSHHFPSPRYLDWAKAWLMPFEMRLALVVLSTRPLTAASQIGVAGLPSTVECLCGSSIMMNKVPIEYS